VDWDTGWHSVLSLHKHSTSIQPVMGSEQPGTSEHSYFQQQEFGNYWGTESLDAAGLRILV
jgi:hypothetical protein